MNDDDSTRNKIRMPSKESNSFYFFTSAYNEPEEVNPKIFVTIDSTIQKLMDEDLENKITVLKTLNQLIKSHQKYIIPKISNEIINKFCLLTNVKSLECLSLQFLNILIQLCPVFYQYFVSTGFYSYLIQRIQPNESIQFYKQILLFLTTTIKKIPESIIMMLNFGILDNIKKMDQTQFIEQLRIIYSSSFIQIQDFSILDSILFYLTFPKSELILETLKCIKKCISNDHVLEKIWGIICFDERLVSLLTNENSDVVSITISIFSMIFTTSNEAIKQLFEHMEILNAITSYLFNEDMNLNAFTFDFLISLINSTDNDSNINNIFELIRSMNIDTNKLGLLNFYNQQKITHLIFDLYLKISCQQIELIFDPDLLKIMIRISQANQEDLHFCLQSLHLISTKISSKEFLYQSISDIISEADLNDDILDVSIE